jgi:3-phytase
VIAASARESDGSDVTSAALGSAFPAGLFVAISNDGSFQLYSWRDISAQIPGRIDVRAADLGTFHLQ